MSVTYWHKQGSEPLFPDLLWSRPENRGQAGKLLIIGGNAHGFAAPAQAYQAAQTAGIGTARVVLPSALQKTVGTFLENAFFAPSTPSGSFARQALADLIEHASWADSVLIAGELGRNSETAILLESFVQKSGLPLTITRDAVDYFAHDSINLLTRSQTTIVLSIAQLQKLAQNAKFAQPITFGMDLIKLVDALHQLTEQYPAAIIVKHLETILVAVGGQVSTTHLKNDKEIWRVETAAFATVWKLQNPSKPLEALTTAVYETTVAVTSGSV
jgi:NAD(P)H-hydrate repair Nnr-like enzyme with NAD(P)H-hydrate dehydratase domain